jgi:S1-C subfamily serine protease
MNRRLVFATVLIIAALIIGSQLKAQEPTPAIPPSQVVRVLVEDRDGRSAGTGALIAADLVITANHVVKDRKRTNECEILFPSWELIPGKVIGVDSKKDLALIRLSRKASCRPLGYMRSAPTPGDRLLVCGYGYAPFKAAWGKADSKKWGTWRQVLGARARSGDSGGPILDENGNYVGTLWGSDKDGTMYTPLPEVLRFMSKHVKIVPDPNDDYDLSWRRWRFRRNWRMPSPFADFILRRAFRGVA